MAFSSFPRCFCIDAAFSACTAHIHTHTHSYEYTHTSLCISDTHIRSSTASSCPLPPFSLLSFASFFSLCFGFQNFIKSGKRKSNTRSTTMHAIKVQNRILFPQEEQRVRKKACCPLNTLLRTAGHQTATFFSHIFAQMLQLSHWILYYCKLISSEVTQHLKAIEHTKTRLLHTERTREGGRGMRV